MLLSAADKGLQAESNITAPKLLVEPQHGVVFKGKKSKLICSAPGGGNSYFLNESTSNGNWKRVDMCNGKKEIYAKYTSKEKKYRCWYRHGNNLSPPSNEVLVSILDIPQVVLSFQHPEHPVCTQGEQKSFYAPQGMRIGGLQYEYSELYAGSCEISTSCDKMGKYELKAERNLTVKYRCRYYLLSSSQTVHSPWSSWASVAVTEKNISCFGHWILLGCFFAANSVIFLISKYYFKW